VDYAWMTYQPRKCHSRMVVGTAWDGHALTFMKQIKSFQVVGGGSVHSWCVEKGRGCVGARESFPGSPINGESWDRASIQIRFFTSIEGLCCCHVTYDMSMEPQ
jgi:hypothetical protein